jgi:glucosylglycerate synthase
MMAREENPEGISRAEIVVGIPSYNEAQTISFPTQQVDKGLSKYYQDRPAVIINCDNDSPDATREAFLGTATKTPKIYVSTGDGVRGKGNNLRNLFNMAAQLDAKAVVVVDADLKSITPLWIRNLAEPLFDSYHFVAPLYIRHKYEATVTNSIAYPLTRALYGRRVRQPIAGDLGFSGELCKIYQALDGWDDAVANFGINIWMTTTAVQSRFSVIQSFMGRPKIHTFRDIPDQLDAMFRDVVGTLFGLMIRFEDFWKDVKWSRPTAVFGFGVGDLPLPPPVDVEPKKIYEDFTSGLGRFWDLYREVLAVQHLNKLEEVASLPQEGFELPTGLWAKVLYDFACAYKNQTALRDDLLSALIPLYWAKTLSFVLETQAMNNQQVEEYIEDQCIQFEKAKPYLVERWSSS